MTASTVILVVGYLLAVPFSIWPPGFLRMWRRREPWVVVCEEAGVALIVAGWLAKGDASGTAVNATWGVGLAIAYGLEGRKRAAQTRSHTAEAEGAVLPVNGSTELPRDRHPS